MVGLIAIGVQIPALLTLARLLQRVVPVLAGAALLTLPFLWSSLRNPFDRQPRSRLHVALVMWPFDLTSL